ncbi:hypothetical protein EOD42_23270 [Rhodovarius crocodyli]|uniref:Uncharacterized protein n=1 Tax=Rhodovarius crocodyli TaxID=1979269 RepID=A0A437LZD1_9PROT|nr:hypothetical protein [Rhodovarius crocodyli]RVT90725.1 hypothetical protein EOD42_23270 [Rhodovarius crocodyli]
MTIGAGCAIAAAFCGAIGGALLAKTILLALWLAVGVWDEMTRIALEISFGVCGAIFATIFAGVVYCHEVECP